MESQELRVCEGIKSAVVSGGGGVVGFFFCFLNESWDWEARGREARSAVDKQIDRPTDRPTDQPTEPTGLKKKEGNEEGWLHECNACRAGIVLPDSLSSALQSGRALDSGLC
jgi:hypothetical protein